MVKKNYNMIHYKHHTYISNLFDSLDNMKEIIGKYVKLAVDNFNKWFLDLPIFNVSKLFNPKHNIDKCASIFILFFGFDLLKLQLQYDHHLKLLHCMFKPYNLWNYFSQFGRS
jgi:hypothetical protein